MKMPDLLGNILKDSKTRKLICSIWSKHEEHMEIIVLYNKRKKSSVTVAVLMYRAIYFEN